MSEFLIHQEILKAMGNEVDKIIEHKFVIKDPKLPTQEDYLKSLFGDKEHD